MVSKLGVNLNTEAGAKPTKCQCGGTRKPNHGHHDHVIDAAHEEARNFLDPAEFNTWTTTEGKSFYDDLKRACTSPRKKVVRFDTTWVCNKCNPVDGNGKLTSARDGDTLLRFYSMTPGELIKCRTPASFKKAYERDKDELEKRVCKAQQLAKNAVKNWLKNR